MRRAGAGWGAKGDRVSQIYLNAAGHGLPDGATCRTMIAHLELEAQIGAERAMAQQAEALRAVRAAVGRLLGAETGRVGFCPATTPLWLRVADRLSRPGARVVLSALEWGAHLRHMQDLAPRLGLRLDIIPAAESFDPAVWAARLKEDTAFLAVPMVTSIAGQALPLAQVAALPRPESCLLLVDGAQGFGRLPVPGMAQGCDIVVGTARKWLRAPRQTGVFSLSERAEAVLGLNVQDFEGSIPNVALRLGLGQALAAWQDNETAIMRHLDRLDAQLRGGLQARRPDLALCPPGAAGTVTALIPDPDRAATQAALERAGIVAKWADPPLEEPGAGFAPGWTPLRVSPHVYSSAEDIAAFLETMARV